MDNKCKENIEHKIGVASGKFTATNYHYTAKNLKLKTQNHNSKLKTFSLILHIAYYGWVFLFFHSDSLILSSDFCFLYGIQFTRCEILIKDYGKREFLYNRVKIKKEKEQIEKSNLILSK